MINELQVRVAVVTGAGSGIGRSVAERLVRDGLFVVAVELDSDKAAVLAKGLGPSSEVLCGDVAIAADLARAREMAESKGALVGWVNNAGIALGGNLHAPIVSEVQRLFDVNLNAVYWGCAEAVQSFIKHGNDGAIVNTSSIHGRAAFPGWAAYDTAKGGIDALTRYIAVEYGPLGIRANAVAPGAIRTEMVMEVISAAENPSRAEIEMSEIHPMERLGEPEEVAALVSFLISDEASFVSGQSIAVDGAASARCFRYEPSADIRRFRAARNV